MTKYEFKERWYATKRLWRCEEFFLATAQHTDKKDEKSPIEYGFDLNTCRTIFFKFVNDYIKGFIKDEK